LYYCEEILPLIKEIDKLKIGQSIEKPIQRFIHTIVLALFQNTMVDFSPNVPCLSIEELLHKTGENNDTK
jgi:hypothetical protein